MCERLDLASLNIKPGRIFKPDLAGLNAKEFKQWLGFTEYTTTTVAIELVGCIFSNYFISKIAFKAILITIVECNTK